MSDAKVVSLTSRRGHTTLDIVMERLNEAYIIDAPSAKFADNHFKALMEQGWTVKQAGLLSNILIPSDAPNVSVRTPGVEVHDDLLAQWLNKSTPFQKFYDPRSGLVGGIIAGLIISALLFIFLF